MLRILEMASVWPRSLLSVGPKDGLRVMREQLQQATKNYDSAINRLENPEGSLKDSNDVLDTLW